MSREQFSDLCRTCMSLGAKSFLFSPVDSLAQQITSFIDIKMLPGDELPDKICKSCVNKLQTLNDFVTLCETSDKILREIFQNTEKCPKTINTHIIKEEIALNSYSSDGYENEDDDFDNNAKLLENIDRIKLNQTNIGNEKCKLRIKQPMVLIERIKDNYFDVSTKLLENIDTIKLNQINIETKKNLNKLEKSKDQLSVSVNEKTESQKKEPVFLKIPTVCNDCGRKCVSYSDYLRHRRVHTGEKPFKCSFCPAAFSTKGILTVHLRTHTGEKPYICTLCFKAFTTQSQLGDHLQVHNKLKAYSCSHCPKTFTRKSRAKDHARIHMKTKNAADSCLICGYCGIVLKSTNNLKVHTRIHTGERPYECKICKKRFTQSATHTRHMRLHTGEKPYKCNFCNKRFVTQSSMLSHRNLHTKSKNYRCVTCDKTYLSNSSLRRHIVNTHIRPLEGGKTKEGIYKKRFYRKMECHICLKRVNRLNRHMDQVHKNIVERNKTIQ